MNNAADYVRERWQLLTAFSKKEDLKDKLWSELLYRYTEPHRAYHNINHIAYLFRLFDSYVKQVQSPLVMGFAILYHDVVYDTYRKDNEDLSAELAAAHMAELQVNRRVVSAVQSYILATKDYQVPAEADCADDLALFLDIDMAVLGADTATYQLYSQKIRQEYGQYSDATYNEGRKLALKRFLEAPSIYRTEDFRIIVEDTARSNIQKELDWLG